MRWSAQYLSAFIRRADLVKIACLAQIVNVIAPVLTRRNGLLIQSTYWPFVLYSRFARGVSLTPIITSDVYHAGERGEVPAVDVAASYDASTHSLAVFLINRSQTAAATVDVKLADMKITKIVGVELMGGGNVKAANSWDAPDTVVPTVGHASLTDGVLRLKVPSPGLAVVRAEAVRR